MADSHLSEEWRPVEGYDGYEASSEGRVRSWRPTGPNRPRPSAPKVLTPRRAKSRMWTVKLAVGGGKHVAVGLGKVVALAFHGVPSPGEDTLHRRDRDGGNNRAGNLFWGARLILHPCAVPGCDQMANGDLRGAGDYCSRHYQRLRSHGDPEGGRVSPGTLLDWVLRHIDYDGEACLQWPFATNGGGYGAMFVGGRHVGAHVVMCSMAHGPAPEPDMETAHSCGRGHHGCVHPGHLRWDTRAGNHADKWVHGTMPHGETHVSAKLTEEDVRWIRSNVGKITYKAMAATFGVHEQTAFAVASGKSWRHLA